MIKPPIDLDELLKTAAAESAKQGEGLRTTVRELTLNALRERELSLAQIKQVLNHITEGVSIGAASPQIDMERVLEDALAGMDDALIKAVEAQRIALQQLASQGQSFRESHVKKALDDLEGLEGDFLKTVKQAANSGGDKVAEQWATLLRQKELSGTGTGAQVAATLEQFGDQMRAALVEQRRASLEAAQAFCEHFSTLASGILIGLTEGLQQGRKATGRKGETGPGAHDSGPA